MQLLFKQPQPIQVISVNFMRGGRGRDSVNFMRGRCGRDSVSFMRGGRDRMLVWLTTTGAISAYHH